ncbi:hypothetical protein M9H77_28068 [Catharanthus roseus]|uniref:Uncharacterized protein n=1 Tax=Catharanthus roseus TaxID=4058 RepID=A0ACC0AEI0_CATRO|nr:hypothetical protein M9H77_28068 [Catharanthus roseus]
MKIGRQTLELGYHLLSSQSARPYVRFIINFAVDNCTSVNSTKCSAPSLLTKDQVRSEILVVATTDVTHSSTRDSLEMAPADVALSFHTSYWHNHALILYT